MTNKQNNDNSERIANLITHAVIYTIFIVISIIFHVGFLFVGILISFVYWCYTTKNKIQNEVLKLEKQLNFEENIYSERFDDNDFLFCVYHVVRDRGFKNAHRFKVKYIKNVENYKNYYNKKVKHNVLLSKDYRIRLERQLNMFEHALQDFDNEKLFKFQIVYEQISDNYKIKDVVIESATYSYNELLLMLNVPKSYV